MPDDIQPLDEWLDSQPRLTEILRQPKPKPAKAAKKPERVAQEAVVAWLRKAGCIVSRSLNEVTGSGDANQRARFWNVMVRTGCTKGMPDLSAILPDGRTIYIEMKAPGKKPSEAQAELHDKMRARGAIVVWGTDVWSVQAALAEQGVVLSGNMRMSVPARPLAGAR